MLNVRCVLSLVCIVHPVLQQMEWHAKRCETKLLIKTQLLEPEEVLPNLFGEVASNELLAAVCEGTGSVCSNSGRIERRSLQQSATVTSKPSVYRV